MKQETHKPATCSLCGQEWPRDPRVEVPCPVCQAGIGHWCIRPSGHKAMAIHTAREELAIERGTLTKECPGSARAIAVRMIGHSATIGAVTKPVPTPCEPWSNQQSLF